MPLTPQYTWSQDDASLTLKVSLSSAAGVTRNTRVECTDAMVKITCPPYFLQVRIVSRHYTCNREMGFCATTALEPLRCEASVE